MTIYAFEVEIADIFVETRHVCKVCSIPPFAPGFPPGRRVVEWAKGMSGWARHVWFRLSRTTEKEGPFQ